MRLKEFLIFCTFVWIGHSTPINERKEQDLIETKIIGGVNATRGEMPWMVSLQYNSFGTLKHMCGGVLLNSTHILTAAHCISGISLEYLSVVAGALRLFNNESPQQTRFPLSTSVHPSYENYPSIRHDIAFLEVSTPFNLNSNVARIQLAPEGHAANGFCTIAGWGAPSNNILLKASVPIVTKAKCFEYYGSDYDTEYQICAGYDAGGVDTCTGDTGGPIVCNDLDYPYVAGISSWGYGCGEAKKPGVYTEVGPYTTGFTQPVFIRKPWTGSV